MKNPIIVITGPTASGKTAISLDLAREFNGSIITADSTTVYKGMDIGTDKPGIIRNPKIISQNDNSKLINSENQSKLETQNSEFINGVEHFLIGILEPDQEFNIAKFQGLVAQSVCEIEKEGKIPFLVGGSTLYIDSFLYGYELPKVKPDSKLRVELEQKSNEELFCQLIELDPEAELAIDKNNKRRLVRALEVSIKTGEPFTKQKTKKPLPKNVLYLAIRVDREKLYEKINQRVDEMFARGFVDEVKKLLEKYGPAQALEAAGYRQVVQYLNNEISLDQAIEKIKQVHRNYAKRQMTWLSANPDVIWINDQSEAEQEISDFLSKQ